MWRFLWTYFFSRLAPTLSIFDEATIHFYVLPTDIDLLGHMNNGRYFSLMDVARLDFLIRAKIFKKLSKNKIYAVVASEMMRFKKSLNLFQGYQVTTRVMGWDDKFFYIMHHFKVKQKVYATSVVKIVFLSKNTLLGSANVLSVLNIHKASPDLPVWIKDWQQTDRDLHMAEKDMTR